jgi:hypothetical protein
MSWDGAARALPERQNAKRIAHSPRDATTLPDARDYTPLRLPRG